MKDKLKVKVWNYKNIVLFEVLEQDESLRNTNFEFKASNGWGIYSWTIPAISSDNEIFIRGQREDFDEDIGILKTETVGEAKRVVKEVRQAVKEFNESQPQVLTDKEKEYLSAVIKPFKNSVKYIKKYGSGDYEEFISIMYVAESDTDLPCFKKDTMYKGMEKKREYTLEELGL